MLPNKDWLPQAKFAMLPTPTKAALFSWGIIKMLKNISSKSSIQTHPESPYVT